MEPHIIDLTQPGPVLTAKLNGVTVFSLDIAVTAAGKPRMEITMADGQSALAIGGD